MAKLITINGADGEGGGQILRSGLALSLLTGTAMRFERIRAGRARPGLMRQHLTALKAAAQVGQAEVSGDQVGSQTLEFRPGTVRAGDYAFAIGTAGSTALVLQTVLLPLLAADGPSSLVLEGATHNPLAPTFEFLDRVYVPLLRRMGAQVELRLDKPGFYPAGGGRLTVKVRPSSLRALSLLERGDIKGRRGEAFFAALPFDIAKRELSTLREKLGWPAESFRPRQSNDSLSPGNVVSVEIESDHVTELFSAIGEKGVRGELVAERVATEVLEYLTANVPVGRHLADQLLMPLALAGSGAFTTLPLTAHAHTQINLLRQVIGTTIVVTTHATGARIEVGETVRA